MLWVSKIVSKMVVDCLLNLKESVVFFYGNLFELEV